MKKLSKLKFQELSEVMPVLNERELQHYVGGCGCNNQGSIYFQSLYNGDGNQGSSVYNSPYSFGSSSSGGYGSNGSDSWWNSAIYFVSEMMPEAITASASFTLAFVGGMNFEVGAAYVFSGEDKGWNRFTTVAFAAGLHAEASANLGFVFFSGDSEDFDFDENFGGTGYSIGADYFGGISVGGGEPSELTGDYTEFFKIGGGPAIGGSVCFGHTNTFN